MAAAAPSDEIPSEIQESLAAFEESLRSAEGTLRSLMSVPRSELVQKLDPVEQAKLDLASAYTLNSMFWIYLITQGVNPKEHAVKQELVIKLPVLFCRFSYSNGCAERIRTYMNKVKEITDRKKASRLDKGVASRIVRSALWEAKAEGGQKRKPKSLPHSKSKK